MSRLKAWWAKRVNRTDDPAWRLYRGTAAPATQPARLQAFGLEDTPETRFELLALHLAAAWARMEAGDRSVRGLKQSFSEAFVADMDASLRDMGAGDLGVGKRVKALMQRLYGRFKAYAPAFTAEPEVEAVEAALERNLYKDIEGLDSAVVAAARRETARVWASWQALTDEEIRSGAAPDIS